MRISVIAVTVARDRHHPFDRLPRQRKPQPVAVLQQLSAVMPNRPPVDFRVPSRYRCGAMNVVKATRQFEEWLGHRTDLVKKICASNTPA